MNIIEQAGEYEQLYEKSWYKLQMEIASQRLKKELTEVCLAGECKLTIKEYNGNTDK